MDTSMSEQEEIRIRLKEAYRGVNRAKAELRKAETEVDLVQADCEHPNAVTGSHMGESCRHCPDCEKHDI